MSAAQRFLHADGAGSYAPPVLSPRPMDFFQLQDRFWQLDAQQSFTPAETRLYMYWLNRFNKEFWPGSLPRTVKQVAADLSMDEKTIDKARKALEERGLISYQAGNKKVSAQWFLPAQVDRKNSGQTSKNSPQMDRKNSGANEGNPENSPQMDRKNSAPYKEENKNSSVVENQNEEKGRVASPTAELVRIFDGSWVPLPAQESYQAEDPDASASRTGGGGPEPTAARLVQFGDKMFFEDSRYATPGEVQQVATNLSLGAIFPKYYIQLIRLKYAGELRDERGWKNCLVSFLTGDARSKSGLVRTDPGLPKNPAVKAGAVETRSSTIARLRARNQPND